MKWPKRRIFCHLARFNGMNFTLFVQMVKQFHQRHLKRCWNFVWNYTIQAKERKKCGNTKHHLVVSSLKSKKIKCDWFLVFVVHASLIEYNLVFSIHRIYSKINSDEFDDIDESLKYEVLKWFHQLVKTHSALDSWYNASCRNFVDYWICSGDQYLNWKNKGYRTVFDLLQVSFIIWIDVSLFQYQKWTISSLIRSPSQIHINLSKRTIIFVFTLPTEQTSISIFEHNWRWIESSLE